MVADACKKNDVFASGNPISVVCATCIILCKREYWTDILINNYVAATRFNYRDARVRVLAASSDIDEIMLLLLLFYIFPSAQAAELGIDSDHRHACGHHIFSSSPVV